MTEFYAQPYSIDHQGFYFNDTESFQAGMDRLNSQNCEEVEIQFIDGESYQAELAKMASIGQGDIHLWFEVLEEFNENEAQQISYLFDLGYTIKDALDRYEDVYLYQGTAKDYACETFEECYEIPEYLQYYIDYEAIARDMIINGDITEIGYHQIIANASEF